MAVNNRDRIGRALEIIAAGLLPYVDEKMSAAAPGKDWIALLQARDNQRHGTSHQYKKNDLQILLRCLTEEWRAFPALDRVHQNYASELRDIRNRWAHTETFTADDTTRALDTARLLLRAIGAVSEAEEIDRSYNDHLRTTFDDRTRKTKQAAVGVADTPGKGLKSWREVIEPHDDVASGNFNAAEFAADLHLVASGDSTDDEYSDPIKFFARTYVTEGLRDLLDRATRRLSGDSNASPVVNLQTNFGGGKTHSMLALWHLFSGTKASAFPQSVQEVVGKVKIEDLKVRRVALVGTHLGANQPRNKSDGTEVRTLWGELAWQLGGRAAYDVIADSDRTSTPPGDAMTKLIAAHSPALILIDEWVAYARNLNDDDSLVGGRFEAQFTFAQQLTEAVSATPGAMLIISIPASDSNSKMEEGSLIEVGGARGRQALEALKNVVGRKADHWKPANQEESFEIVRRRLFKEPGAEARRDIGAVARAFVDYYRENKGQFPRGTDDTAYQKRIESAYPIHPELFDRLYTDWSTLDRFQRTRGVLRFMSTVIYTLWRDQDPSPLIMPGSVPLFSNATHSELTNYLEDSWKPIIDRDIDGDDATPRKIDDERPVFGKRSLTRRIARTVFIDTAPTVKTEHKGVERPYLWLGVAVPGDTVGNFGSALELLSQRATYIYTDNGRYWFDTSPSIGRSARDRADRLRESPEVVWEEVKDRLRALASDRGDFTAVHPSPESSGDVPDVDTARLVLLSPRLRHRKGAEDSEAMAFALEVFQRHGSGARKHGNMLAFAAFDDSQYVDNVESAVCSYLAWKEIAEDKSLNLPPNQAEQVASRLKQENQTVVDRLRGALCWLLVPVQSPPTAPASILPERLTDTTAGIGTGVSKKLRTSDRLSTVYSAARIRMALDGPLAVLWKRGHVSVGELWSLYTQYPYLDRLVGRATLDRAVTDAFGLSGTVMWEKEGFALAEGWDEGGGRYVGLRVPSMDEEPLGVTDSWLLVRPDLALAQRAAETPPPGHDASPGLKPSPSSGSGPIAPTPPEPSKPALKTRYFGSKTLHPERFARDFGDITKEVLERLAAQEGTELEISVEITARNPDGFTPETIRTVRENSTTLKFSDHGFEEE
ncbi:MAG: DUF499 domain-containing protein [Demequinaceae bacterium]|nr:DUF499 domain-containing protein [Demequinaceae bacterium]